MDKRVVIADDESIIRLDLKEILEGDGYLVVGEAARGDDALAMIKDLQPNLALLEARRRGRRIGIFHIDYEAQYQMTTDYVDAVLADNVDVADVYRICLPIAANCATSAYSDHWIPWDLDKRDIWVRKLPATCINEMNCEFPWFKKGMWDYDLQERFAGWYHAKKNAKRTACLVGIRTEESLNRWRAIHSDRNQNKFVGNDWTLEMSVGIYNAYPIFDWKVEDVWTIEQEVLE